MFLSIRVTIQLYTLYFFGIIIGFWVWFTFSWLSFYFMKYLFGLEALTAVDELFIMDDDRNVANIMSKIFSSNTSGGIVI